MEYKKVKILEIKNLTHNVLAIKTEKPKDFSFLPGQATKLAINKPELKDKKRPFTITSLPSNEYLEFTIKTYEDRETGITKCFSNLNKGDELLILEVFGTISYQGPGVFIAGGAGITPFISILRDLNNKKSLKGNTLIFSNRTFKDIILKEEFDSMKDLKKVYVLTRESSENIQKDRVNLDFLKSNITNLNQTFYICGPIRLVGEIQHYLRFLGADSEAIIVET